MTFPAPGQGPQQPQAPMVPQQPQAAAASFNLSAVMADPRSKWVFLTGAASVVLALAAFMPWANASFLGTTIQVSGTSGDGMLTLILGTAMAVLAGLKTFKPEVLKGSWVGYTLIGLSAVSLLIPVVSFSNFASKDTRGMVSIGFGLWLTFLAAAAAVAFSILNFLATRGAAAQVPARGFAQPAGYPLSGQPVAGQPVAGVAPQAQVPGVAPQQGFPQAPAQSVPQVPAQGFPSVPGTVPQAPQQPQPPVNPQG
ncbi:hypothetical protein [Buchananella felis]|uniref:hypothetical protein n=1 Tax=Buchananella felis TaxID=3231492 RepID=UPI003529A663